jgi:hypothetical protein
MVFVGLVGLMIERRGLFGNRRRELRAKIGPGRQRLVWFHRRGVKLVAVVRQIRQPPKTGDFEKHDYLLPEFTEGVY